MGKYTKEIQICDLCGNDCSVPNKCPLCDKEVCYMCSHVLYDAFGTDLCKKCAALPSINEIFMAWHKHWLNDRAIFLAEIKRLKKALQVAEDEALLIKLGEINKAAGFPNNTTGS